jgi:hypothetical protein
LLEVCPMLYDRPVSELMEDCAAEISEPFRPADVVAWFGQRYPAVKATTVRAHVIGLTANDRSRHHYQWLASKPPLFYKRGHGTLVRFDPAEHHLEGEPPDDSDVEELSDDDEVGAEPVGEEQMEFALEAYLEEFILTNWQAIDWGRPLRLWEDEDGRFGHQVSTPVGRFDFLAVDTDTGVLVVIELKRGRPSDQVVGQAARYMGWLRDEFAEDDEGVEGIIVAGDADDRLYYAARAVPGLHLLLYEVSFALRHAQRG